ncbi:unnamed protein product [Enterobius vermicularis]|uniref:DH domain-containing protein n=1 Tax=Enterobius vermicularis TaxID=51028 RepID=A0A0N4VM96_ENTVE|nr:unnamed protein product [Enterobius vermicularis]
MISQYYCFFQEDYAANLIEESGKNCTETHLTEGEFGTDDLHYLIDFDMAFLGDQPAAYQKHIENIRKEYAHLDDAEYNSQRLKILELFLQIPNIFATKELRERYEEQARKNILNEIDQLSSYKTT